MKNNEFKKQLSDFQYVVIPTENITSMWQDERGMVGISAISKNDRRDHILYFVDGDLGVKK